MQLNIESVQNLNMDNLDLDEGSPMKHGGGNIDFNSPSEDDEYVETMPQSTEMLNMSPFGKKASH